MTVTTNVKGFKGELGVLNDFDMVVLSDAIRLVLNTNGTDDFPTVAETDDNRRIMMGKFKDRLAATPNALQVDTPNYTPPATLQNEEGLSLRNDWDDYDDIY